MKKTILIFLCVNFFSIILQAQFKFMLQGGKSISTIKANADSLLMGDKANYLQGKIVYSFGHLGIGLTLGKLNQDARTYIREQSLPLTPPTIGAPKQIGGGIKTTHLLVGPEICFGCMRKLKFNVGLRAGVSFLQNSTNQLLVDSTIVRYSNTLKSKTAFTINGGLGINYFITNNIGIGLLAEIHSFKIKTTNKKLVSGSLISTEITQRRNYLNAGASIIYKL